MTDEPIVSDRPHNRLTELSARMLLILDGPEHEDVRGIVFLSDDHGSGIGLSGYDDQTEAVADLFVHMQALFKSMGKDLQFVAIPDTTEGLL
jgi:hypothetical protein